jgi:proteasome lid subunit RPN8/RPN11
VIVATPGGLAVRPLRNVSPDAGRGFELDPLEWASVEAVAVVLFHSHPNGANGLSARDRAWLPRSVEQWVFGERLSRHHFKGGQWTEFTGETK